MSNSIHLHPRHGVNPTILQYQCPATGKIWEANELASLGYNKNKKADMYTVAGLKFCPEVQEKLDSGFVVLIVCDETLTTDTKNPFRTGEICYMKKEAADANFNIEVKDMAFITTELFEKIKASIQEGE